MQAGERAVVQKRSDVLETSDFKLSDSLLNDTMF